ncbi:DUF6941 family protein [Nonomuraea solani]|uniref:DUF6941 family protein n=1 Tax=Nonomuraea solani TaxID=1144553 RepID=UPI0011AFEF42|nr:hypothetical protein [Nonomuraea solani]
MDAHIILSDAAQKDASGKVGLLGAGWTITGPKVPPMAVTVFLRIGWEEASRLRRWMLRLLDDQDKVVSAPDDPERRVEFDGHLGLNEASDVVLEEEANLVDLATSLAIQVQTPQLEGGRRYRWVFDVEGEELASIAFVVRKDKAGV